MTARLITAFGVTHDLSGWSRITGRSIAALQQGKGRYGGELETYLRARGMTSADPTGLLPPTVRPSKLHTAFGRKLTVTQWARVVGVVPGAIHYGINAHGSVENYLIRRGHTPDDIRRGTVDDDTEGCPATVGFYGGDEPPEPCGSPVNPTSAYGYCTQHTELEALAEQTMGAVPAES